MICKIKRENRTDIIAAEVGRYMLTSHAGGLDDVLCVRVTTYGMGYVRDKERLDTTAKIEWSVEDE